MSVLGVRGCAACVGGCRLQLPGQWLEAGDEIVVTFDGPDGLKAENRAKLDRAKAQYLLFSGKKRPPEGWPKGRYVARVEVRNDGAVRFERRWEATLN